MTKHARLWLVVGLFVARSAVAAPTVGSLEYLDDSNGFRNVRFGTAVETFSNLQPTDAVEADATCYTRTGDDLTLGSGRLLTIKYCFQQRRLWAVTLQAAGPNNTQALLQYLEQSYGQGAQEVGGEDADGRRYLWMGRYTRAFYSEDHSGITAAARLWSTAVERDAPVRALPAAVDPMTFSDHAAHDTRSPVVQGMRKVTLHVPQHAHPGLSVEIALDYRNLSAPGRLRLQLPQGMKVRKTTPTAYIGGDEIVWSDVQSPLGTVTVNAQIDANVPEGRVLLLRAEMADGKGGRAEDRDTIVLR